MGQGPTPPPGPSPCQAQANGAAALTLLAALMQQGLRQLVLCPGSRSAPLAIAAALLEPHGLQLRTGIDERSAAFMALGLSRGEGMPAAVVTTSGTAVAQLLPAAVEADLGAIPLLLLSADRPARLKGCGANQAVPQENFLRASCRLLLEGPPGGLSEATPLDLEELANQAMASALGGATLQAPGPVHLNLPFEEPLHCDGQALAALQTLAAELAGRNSRTTSERSDRVPEGMVPQLDPTRPGVVVAGPWRGHPGDWAAHLEALRRWQAVTGWPVLADALSGLRGCDGLELIAGYDLFLQSPPADLAAPQVLRLGSLPASRRLQTWLQQQSGPQVLVSPGDPRNLDPLGTVVPGNQWSGGLPAWLSAQTLPSAPAEDSAPAENSLRLSRAWSRAERGTQALLDQVLLNQALLDQPLRGHRDSTAAPPPSEPISLSEPWLARQLSRLLPADLPLMLASSSPVRDWESFADPRAAWRPIHGFRGASGIDGTLSLACGLAEALGQLVLISGDLALLHDANGWLWHRQLRGRLTVLLIENGGGGIFEQLPIRTDPAERLDFERLFAMPQPIDQLALAALHGVPGRRISQPDDLAEALAWALEQPIALLELRTDRHRDAALRRRLRQGVARENGVTGS